MKRVFTEEGNFSAYNSAESAAEELGLLVGGMQRNCPIALLKESNWYTPAPKWEHLKEEDMAEIDGTITGDMRFGPCTLTVFDDDDPNPYVSN